MILVAVGNSDRPFDRLIAAAEEAFRRTGDVDIRWQTGSCTKLPAIGRSSPMFPPEEYADLVRASEILICQGGEGSVMEGVQAGKKPIVMPRRFRFGEVANDHQLELIHELGGLGWVFPAETPEEIAEAMGRIRSGDRSAPNGEVRLIAPRIRELLRELEPDKGATAGRRGTE